MEKIWFVAGAGYGFGLALVKQLLKQGYKVAAVSGNIQPILKIAAAGSENLLPLQVDLSDEDSVSRAAYDAVEYFGKIDVIVNADKEGLGGNIEDLTDEQIRRNFEINIFSGLNVMRAVLPYLKEQRSGHIFNLSAIGKMNGAGLGIYRATEMAMIAIAESLAIEVQPFGIKVSVMTSGNTAIEPGVHTIDDASSLLIGNPHSPITQIQWCMQQLNAIVNTNPNRLQISSPISQNPLFSV